MKQSDIKIETQIKDSVLQDAAFFNALYDYRKRYDPNCKFMYFEPCCDCKGFGCECCDEGIIYYYFNSEPTGLNVMR